MTQKSIVTIAIRFGQFVEDNRVLNEGEDWDLVFREEILDNIWGEDYLLWDMFLCTVWRIVELILKW